jgi:hypothetical protein
MSREISIETRSYTDFANLEAEDLFIIRRELRRPGIFFDLVLLFSRQCFQPFKSG